MRLPGIRALVAVVGAALVAGSALLAAQVTRSRQEEDALRGLVVEMRGLRGAIERLATTGSRAQLTLGRLQMTEQRIASLTTQLETVRDRIRGDVTASFRDEFRSQERDLEQQIATEQARWSEINQRLEELDRTLASPADRP
jgi:hypothetical protein